MKHSRIIFIFSAVIVAMFCILGAFNRPYFTDEFDFHNLVSEKGIIQAVISQYNGTESGRITNHFFLDIFTYFPLEKIYPFEVSVNILVYLLACICLITALFPALSSGAKISLSFMACALTLCFAYSLDDSLYWLGGTPLFFSGTLMAFALGLAIRSFRGGGGPVILHSLHSSIIP